GPGAHFARQYDPRRRARCGRPVERAHLHVDELRPYKEERVGENQQQAERAHGRVVLAVRDLGAGVATAVIRLAEDTRCLPSLRGRAASGKLRFGRPLGAWAPEKPSELSFTVLV